MLIGEQGYLDLCNYILENGTKKRTEPTLERIQFLASKCGLILAKDFRF